MTIKQNGGVFGRNPTFNDVTIEGQLTFDGDIDINSDLKVDGAFEVTGASTLTGDVNVTAGDLSVKNGNEVRAYRSGDSAYASLYMDAGETAYWKNSYSNKTVRLLRDGDLSITSGNLVIGTSGKGIDFSATAGPNPPASGTSELLDDYEEGTWTPTFQLYAGTPTNVSGAYTKVGNLVFIHLSATFDGTSDPSTLRIQGVPFESDNSCGLSFAVNTGATCTVEILGGNIEFKDSSGNDLTYSSYGVSAAFELSGVYYV
jgi:hypothetical protein